MTKKTWDDLLQPVEPLGENEITLRMAMEKLGVLWDDAALRRLAELEMTGLVVCVGQRKLPNGKVAKAWKLL